MNDDFKEFKEYYSLSAKLIKEISKEDLAEVARVLALQLADYQHRFGKIPDRDLLSLLGVAEISTEQAKLLRNGMEILVGHLGNMMSDQEEDGPVH
jgi:hypothetical protein